MIDFARSSPSASFLTPAPQWKDAVASGTVSQPAPPSAYMSSPGEDEVLSLGDMMAFSGPAPELINGRLAMVAFVAALGAELSSGESVIRQWSEDNVAPVAAKLNAQMHYPLWNVPYDSLLRELFGSAVPCTISALDSAKVRATRL